MSASLKCRADASSDASRLLVYYETSTTGIFDGETTLTTSSKTITSSGSSIRAVAVPTNSSYRKVEWSQVRSTTTNTDYGMIRSTTTSTSGDENRAKTTTGTSGTRLTVVDEHGTHSGTPTMGVNNNQFFGCRHLTTESGWTYEGVKVTRSSSSAATIISTGGTTSGTVTTFPASYTGAIILQASSGTVTIEFLYSQPKPKYTLTYNANGGSPTPSSRTVEEGTRITLAAAPTKTGYNFAGWMIGTAKYAAGDDYTVNSNVTAIAQWTQEIVYTVSFDKNSTEVTGDNIPSFTVTQGSSCILPGAVLWIRDKYAFVGWSKTPGGTKEYDAGDPFTPTANTIFYAVWTKDRGEGAQANYYSFTSKTTRTTRTGPFAFNICSNVPTQKLTLKYQTADLGRHLQKHYQYDPSFNPNPKVTTTSQNSQGATLNKTAEIPIGSRSSTAQPTYVLVSIPGDYVSYYQYQRTNTSSDAYYSADELTITTVCDDNWVIEAPELDNFDFVGWFTIHDSIVNGQGAIPTNGDYTLRISEDRELKFGEAYTKCNSICLTNLKDDDEISRTFANMLQAQYIGKLVTVLFDSTGGEIDEFYREVRYIETYGTLPTPVRHGYTFAGWYTQAEGGTRVTASTVVETVTDHVLYAHWTKTVSNIIQVVFTDPTKTNPTAVREIARGTTMKLPWVNSGLGWTTPAGYSLDQAATWKDYSTGQTFANNGDISSVTASILRLSLLLTLKECTVTFDANGGTSDFSSVVVSAGATIGALPKARLSGKIFEGWYTAREGGEKVTTSLIVNSSITLYAHFKTSTPVSWITVKVTD